jgi:hypothetical protein
MIDRAALVWAALILPRAPQRRFGKDEGKEARMARQHARRTCHFCGAQAPQPEMSRQTIFVKTGQSKASLSGATIIGAAAGSRSARNSVVRTLFNTGGRTYYRQREVWCCDDLTCVGAAVEASRQSRKTRGVPIWVGLAVVAVVGLLILLMFAAVPAAP